MIREYTPCHTDPAGAPNSQPAPIGTRRSTPWMVRPLPVLTPSVSIRCPDTGRCQARNLQGAKPGMNALTSGDFSVPLRKADAAPTSAGGPEPPLEGPTTSHGFAGMDGHEANIG